MKLRRRQLGITMWGLMYVLGTMGFAFTVGLKVYPVYLNEMKLQRAVKSVSGELDVNGEVNVKKFRDALRKWWNVEDIEKIEPEDINVVANPKGGRTMNYDYWNQVELFKGIFLSFHFQKEYPLGNGAQY